VNSGILRISRSKARSAAADSLQPSPEKTFKPLYSAGLWEADITTPAPQPYLPIRQLTAGVGIIPQLRQSAPALKSPQTKADSSISPEIRVSLPIITDLSPAVPFMALPSE
jgi:hypothetical protein